MRVRMGESRCENSELIRGEKASGDECEPGGERERRDESEQVWKRV